ncbi:MAG: ATP-binding protein [Mariprofundaceae bacterium]|nr:ATP-binding protein [Mariprofundaceae bacterium]
MGSLNRSQLSCKLNSACDCVHVLCSMVEVMSRRAGLNDKETNRMVLAADELFANIGQHGYHGQEGLIEMIAECHDGSLCFEFRDYAAPLTNEAVLHRKTMDASQAEPGGLGLYLIHASVDKLQHRVLDDGNRWLLIKYLHARS